MPAHSEDDAGGQQDSTTLALHDSRVQRERLRLLLAGLKLNYLGAVLVATLVLPVLYHELPRALLFGWYGYMLAISVVRMLAGRGLAARLAAAETAPALRGLYLDIAAAALGWGALGLFLLLVQQPDHRTLVAVVLAGVTAGSAPVYALVLPAARLFLCIALLPAIVCYPLAGHKVDVVIGIMILAYLGIMLRNAGNLHRNFSEALALRFANASMVAALTAANARAERLNVDLRARIAQGEADQRALVQARDAAQSAAATKAEFLANMSHEIRTPMNGVLGLSELLRDTGLNRRQQHLVDMIHRSGRSLLTIINDILDFSKIDAGKLSLEVRPFDLQAFVEDLGEMFSETAHRAGLELACDVPVTMHTFYRGDVERIRQVLINLLGNALKFTRAGEVVLRVRLVSEDAEGARLRFAVSDTGVGIAPAHQARIFDSFTQADGSTTREFGGTGLGLAICKQLVQLMGGEIGVESAPGEGATFWFLLPLAKARAADLPAPPLDAAALAGQRVLVIGPADTARGVLVAQLEAWRVVALTAPDGARALELLRTQAARGARCSAVVLPRDLADMPASYFTAQVRADVTLAAPRLVMLTTVANLESTGELLGAGVHAYLTKPVRQRELLAALGPGAGHAVGSTRREAAGGGHFSARVLLVEDNLVNQELARSQLEVLGCAVTLVGNGREALEALTERPLDALREPYDLVLMDCQMPVMDGYAASEALRRWEATQGAARLPVVALTANAMAGDRERCLARGMDDYLAKPFSAADLERTLARWLPRAAPAAPSTPGAAFPPASPPVATDLDGQVIARIVALQRDGKPDLLAHLIGLFLASVPRLLGEVEHGLAAADVSLVRRALHTLKSSSANLGGAALAKLTGELENAARAGNLAAIGARVDVLRFELDCMDAALRALRPEARVPATPEEQMA